MIDIQGLKKEIKDINKKQQELKDEIIEYNQEKVNVVDSYAHSDFQYLDDMKTICHEIREHTHSKDNNIKEINDAFMNLYFKAFYRIVNKRVKTPYKDDAFKTYSWSNKETRNIWINNKGIASRNSYSSLTTTTDSYDIVIKVLKKFPDLKKYITLSKQKIYDIVYKCAKDWIIIPSSQESIYKTKGEFLYIDIEEDGEYGISNIELKKKKYLNISYSQRNLQLELSDRSSFDYWDTKMYNLLGELDENNYHRRCEEGLSERATFVLSQIPEEGQKKIMEYAELYKTAKENNLNLLTNMHNELTPYLVIKEL